MDVVVEQLNAFRIMYEEPVWATVLHPAPRNAFSIMYDEPVWATTTATPATKRAKHNNNAQGAEFEQVSASAMLSALCFRPELKNPLDCTLGASAARHPQGEAARHPQNDAGLFSILPSALCSSNVSIMPGGVCMPSALPTDVSVLQINAGPPSKRRKKTKDPQATHVLKTIKARGAKYWHTTSKSVTSRMAVWCTYSEQLRPLAGKDGKYTIQNNKPLELVMNTCLAEIRFTHKDYMAESFKYLLDVISYALCKITPSSTSSSEDDAKTKLLTLQEKLAEVISAQDPVSRQAEPQQVVVVLPQRPERISRQPSAGEMAFRALNSLYSRAGVERQPCTGMDHKASKISLPTMVVDATEFFKMFVISSISSTAVSEQGAMQLSRIQRNIRNGNFKDIGSSTYASEVTDICTNKGAVAALLEEEETIWFRCNSHVVNIQGCQTKD